MPLVVLVVARIVSLVCVLVLGAAAFFDVRTERFTAGVLPPQVAGTLDVDVARHRREVTVVAHNAGDDLPSATRAIAYGADAIEIDVRASGNELFASHDAQIPLLEDLVFRGPTLTNAWEVAELRDTVLLHLKESGSRYLGNLRRFLAARPLERVITQTGDHSTLEVVRRTIPRATRLLLIFKRQELVDLRRDARLLREIDGVSVRDELLTPSVLRWLEQRRLLTFAWSIDDERRANALVTAGADGIITDRLDLMELFGQRRGPGS